jgi:hypothetical protein
MATKKTTKTTEKDSKGRKPAGRTTAKKAAPKGKVAAAKKPVAVKKGPKPAAVKVAARHPKGAVAAQFGSKEALAAQLAPTLARADQDTDAVAATLKTASNAQLLRLHAATVTVKDKYGSRDKLIAAISDAQKKSKDKDFLAKLETYSLPHLLELARA